MRNIKNTHLLVAALFTVMCYTKSALTGITVIPCQKLSESAKPIVEEAVKLMNVDNPDFPFLLEEATETPSGQSRRIVLDFYRSKINGASRSVPRYGTYVAEETKIECTPKVNPNRPTIFTTLGGSAIYSTNLNVNDPAAAEIIKGEIAEKMFPGLNYPSNGVLFSPVEDGGSNVVFSLPWFQGLRRRIADDRYRNPENEFAFKDELDRDTFFLPPNQRTHDGMTFSSLGSVYGGDLANAIRAIADAERSPLVAGLMVLGSGDKWHKPQFRDFEKGGLELREIITSPEVIIPIVFELKTQPGPAPFLLDTSGIATTKTEAKPETGTHKDNAGASQSG